MNATHIDFNMKKDFSPKKDSPPEIQTIKDILSIYDQYVIYYESPSLTMMGRPSRVTVDGYDGLVCFLKKILENTPEDNPNLDMVAIFGVDANGNEVKLKDMKQDV